jgi:putative DNA primase/helicase
VNAAAWASRYVERLELALTPLRGKAPIREGWNLDENLLRTPGAAREYFSRNPHDNMGACLEASGLVSVDADDPEGARLVLTAEGIDLDALMASTPTIIGRAPRLEFKAPNATLGRKSVVWPPRNAGEKPVTVVELRAGRVQDVLPPSIHPDTKQPYRWITPPRDGFPALPESLLTLWQNFDAFKHSARNLCPWAEAEPEPSMPAPRRLQPPTGPSVIAAFNEAHDTAAILEAHGYTRTGKRRWKSPNGHGVAGVVVLPSGKVFCHHVSDGLGDGHAHDAFDLYAHLEHGGDTRAAVKQAAALLGLERKTAHGR